MNRKTPSVQTVPADFPREALNTLLSGAQPKIGLRRINGKIYAGLTEEELFERYDACDDLAQQLAAYCTRKAEENPEWTRAFNLERTERGVARRNQEEWDLSAAELAWVFRRMRAILDW
ncbi:hypothetical protein [Paraburkholderia sp. MM6662-R1]|uniref:hypothetical protein n=1 Tax=Paraburkholderia sp. MM6662-R1 TaxID=2991066 RepID=UPI003D2297E6